MAPQDEGNSYKKRDRNGVWESSSTERAAGIVKASRDYAARGHVGVCGREALPRARMRWGEMKSKGQAAFYPTRQNSKGETCGGCAPRRAREWRGRRQYSGCVLAKQGKMKGQPSPERAWVPEYRSFGGTPYGRPLLTHLGSTSLSFGGRIRKAQEHSPQFSTQPSPSLPDLPLGRRGALTEDPLGPSPNKFL